MSRVVHFEIQADVPERAGEFYSRTFDWKIQKWDGPEDYWLIETGPAEQPGINGGLVQRRAPIEGHAVIAFVCTIDVPDIDSAVDRIEANGGRLVVPKMAVPGVGWLVYFKDTESNIAGIMQSDPEAA